MFKLVSCLYVSQKVQNLVKLLSGSSDPSIVQSGECMISQACITENDGIAGMLSFINYVLLDSFLIFVIKH